MKIVQLKIFAAPNNSCTLKARKKMKNLATNSKKKSWDTRIVCLWIDRKMSHLSLFCGESVCWVLNGNEGNVHESIFFANFKLRLERARLLSLSLKTLNRMVMGFFLAFSCTGNATTQQLWNSDDNNVRCA